MFSDLVDDSGNEQSLVSSPDVKDVFRKIYGLTIGWGIEFPTIVPA